MIAEKISWSSSPYWNICLLAFAWALTLSTSTLLTTVGPLSATSLGASKSLAAFTVGVFLIGAALSSVPSGWIFKRYGRFGGFALGCLCQVIGSALGTLAMFTDEIFWLYLGCLSIGLAQGLGQFYRFSAVEITPVDFKSRAITYVLSGGVIAAFVGPTVANFTVNLVAKDYVGTYLVVALFAGLNLLVICLVRFPPAKGRDEKQSPSSSRSISFREAPETRSTWMICSQPLFIISCTIATLAHTIMVMIMSNVSIDMNHNGYSFTNSSLTLELHFVAMFGPGFFTGKLIQKHGSFVVALIGGLIFAGSSVVLAIGTELWNYIVGMILVGIAWNFSFSAGTVMLTSSYRPDEATAVQAVNDFVLFSVAGAGSLLSGAIYAAYGWLVLIYVVSVLMVVYLALFFFALKRRKEIMEAEQAQYKPLMEEDEAEEEEEEGGNKYQAPNTLTNQSPFHRNHGLSAVAEGDGTEENETESDKKQRHPNKTGPARTKSTSTNPIVGMIHSVGDVLGHGLRGASFTENDPSHPHYQHPANAPLLTGGPASVGGVMSGVPSPTGGQHPLRTISTASQQGYHNQRTMSIVDIENAVDDDLRPVRSMSVA